MAFVVNLNVITLTEVPQDLSSLIEMRKYQT